jgi:hypothetical protein
VAARPAHERALGGDDALGAADGVLVKNCGLEIYVHGFAGANPDRFESRAGV